MILDFNSILEGSNPLNAHFTISYKNNLNVNAFPILWLSLESAPRVGARFIKMLLGYPYISSPKSVLTVDCQIWRATDLVIKRGHISKSPKNTNNRFKDCYFKD